MPTARQSRLALATAVAVLAACHHTDLAGPDAARAAGTYLLETVSGRGPAAGTMVLSGSGGAERRVLYPQRGRGLLTESVARGSFTLRRDGSVDLRLREDDGQSSYVWRPRANLSGGVLQLRHPDPADGPDIVESYRRQ